MGKRNSNKEAKEYKNDNLHDSITKNQIIIGLIFLVGVLFFFNNNNFNNILGIISDKLSKIWINTAQKVPTPTPELSTSCVVGKFSLELQKTRCESLQSYIKSQKQIDISMVQELINDLNVQLQESITSGNNTSQNDFKGKLEKVLEGCTGNESEVYRCKLSTLGTLTQIYGQEYQKARELQSQLEEQLSTYQNYLLKIRLGGIVSGACLNHEGVDCSTPRGSIGQVICADGWSQSNVYYFNIEECVEYTESTLIP